MIESVAALKARAPADVLRGASHIAISAAKPTTPSGQIELGGVPEDVARDLRQPSSRGR